MSDRDWLLCRYVRYGTYESNSVNCGLVPVFTLKNGINIELTGRVKN